MNGTLDDQYLEWLYGLIGAVSNRNPARSYWEMSKQLYSKEFIWFIPNDDNRVEDGIDLRYEFMDEKGLENVDPEWLGLGCSMLEMLIALSRRAAWDSYGEPGEWYWKLLENMEILKYTDAVYNRYVQGEIDHVMDRIIQRTYNESGSGGIFPLRNAEHDQRKVELRYQLAAYLMEGAHVGNQPAV